MPPPFMVSVDRELILKIQNLRDERNKLPKGSEAYYEVDTELDRAIQVLANLIDRNTLIENTKLSAKGPYSPTEQELAFERQREAERQLVGERQERQREALKQKQLAADRERRLAERQPKKGGKYKTKRMHQKRKTKIR
jgi:hypothetical protein